jgi:hypothetical protein
MTRDEIEQKKQVCAEFTDELVNMAKERDIPPRLLIRLFGLVGRYLVDAGVVEGHTRAEATQAIIDLFAQGLTIKPELSLAARKDTPNQQ